MPTGTCPPLPAGRPSRGLALASAAGFAAAALAVAALAAATLTPAVAAAAVAIAAFALAAAALSPAAALAAALSANALQSAVALRMRAGRRAPVGECKPVRWRGVGGDVRGLGGGGVGRLFARRSPIEVIGYDDAAACEHKMQNWDISIDMGIRMQMDGTFKNIGRGGGIFSEGGVNLYY